MREDFFSVGQLLREASRVLFICGAGLSAESGIPTFRGRRGLGMSLTMTGGMTGKSFI